MLPGLVFAALLAASPEAPPAASAEPPPDGSASAGASITVTATAAAPKPAKKPKPSPEARLAELDQKRLEIHTGLRGYGRYLGGPMAIGASYQLGLGVRVVRGLYVTGELGAGAHVLPFGAGAQGFLGLRHELRVTKWVRPSISLGYSHLVDATFEGYGFGGELGGSLGGELDDCRCQGGGAHGGGGLDSGVAFDLDGGGSVEIASRSGVQAGLGLRFPFKRAPRLSLYLRGDAAYYFDDRPGRLQAGVGLGLQVVF